MAKKKKKNKTVESMSCECRDTDIPDGSTDEILTGTDCGCANSDDSEIIRTGKLSIFPE